MKSSKKKIVYILSEIDKAIAFEWIVNYLSGKVELSFILLNKGESDLEVFLNKNNVSVKRVSYSGKKDFLKSLLNIVRELKKTKPDAIHCHLVDATLIGLIAGKITGIKKRIYTRHHSTYNHQYNRKGVFLDRVINFLATDIVAISINVENVLVQKEEVPKSKVHLIHHGFDLDAFQKVTTSEVHDLRTKYNINDKPVLGVIARWVEWKGIQYIIPSFKEILREFPNAILLLANAKGPYASYINVLLNDLPERSYRIIEFESNLFGLYQLFDIYIHVPIDFEIEAYGQTYVEALSAGIPSVFTLSGIASEFIVHERNALVVPYMNSKAIYRSIKLLLLENELREKLIKNGKKDIMRFNLENMLNQLEQLYITD